MKEGRHVSLYIADFRSLASRIGDWGERALIYQFRKGLPSRILDQLASHPSKIELLQDLMDINLKLDTRYHERQQEKSHQQDKKPEASKDEVFKEIQDVGEDNSVSSLHLFFANMDLPPSTYSDSLEELWDEEEDLEEVQNMINVLPPAYHQYLNVFSKVKSDKFPHHRTCDHQIDLEGSLPPAEVIYSLSNQESDTLRAYIS
ncbi:hypothetical protein O181_014864 [Austropuccinia psidii MF-1]|uniref:Retrotransposon gag domain-containing protein n=1 Tax=Austropuccinia psidii MF-1 TaxID=1389203 RepID=A0A9Q3GQ97_9BASI|nr:hypothetical protein [Austropuccinia psidii MF-1]